VNLLRQVAVGDCGGDAGDVADLAGQVGRHRVHVVGQVLPGARHALDPRLAAQPPLGTDFARHARHFRGERPELVDHRVDRVLELEELALHVDRDLLGQIAVRHAVVTVGDVAHLAGQVRRHQVHVVGQVLPRAGHPLDPRLAAQLALGADFARHARHFRGERRELIDHPVHGSRGAEELALERPLLELEGQPLRQVAVGDRADHARHLAGRVHQVVDQRVHGLAPHRPRSARAADRQALRDLAFLADHVRDLDQVGGLVLSRAPRDR
jgi:hypothetical protein